MWEREKPSNSKKKKKKNSHAHLLLINFLNLLQNGTYNLLELEINFSQIKNPENNEIVIFLKTVILFLFFVQTVNLFLNYQLSFIELFTLSFF